MLTHPKLKTEMKNLQTAPDSPRSVFSIPSGLSSALPTAGHQMQRSAISLHTFPTILTSSRSRIPSRLCSILFSDRLSLLLPKNRICPTLSPLRLRVVSSGLVEKVLLLGSKSFSGPIGARNSTPCLHLRHKCKRLLGSLSSSVCICSEFDLDLQTIARSCTQARHCRSQHP